MSVFKTINLTIEKKAYILKIQNIDLAGDHWGSEKDIVSYLDDVEAFTFDKPNFDRAILKHVLALKKYTPRATAIKFFRIPEENKLIVLVYTKVPRFKKVDILSREMSISFSDSGITFAVVELLEEEEKEMKEKKIALPANWQPDEYLNDRFNMMQELL
jgi:hypothetical protein